MLTGKELILATKPFAREDRWRSWYYLLTTLFLLCGSLMGAYLIQNVIPRLMCSIFAGLVMGRMFVIYHDHQHHTILKGSLAANIIMALFGIYMLAPTSIWKRSHDYHHNNNSKLFSASIGSYPIVTKDKFLSMSKKEQRAYLFTRHPLTILFGYIFMFASMSFYSFKSNPKKHFDSLIALILHVTYIALVVWFLGWQGWLFGIFIPFFIPCSLGAYLFYVQHNFPGVWFASSKEWKYEEAALKSSSFLYTNPFMMWVTANIGYHHIHHLNAKIPFYKLPDALAGIPELQKATKTTLKMKDIIACFRLKVWDSQNQEMIGLAKVYAVNNTHTNNINGKEYHDFVSEERPVHY